MDTAAAAAVYREDVKKKGLVKVSPLKFSTRPNMDESRQFQGQQRPVPLRTSQYFSDEVLEKAKTAKMYIEHLYKSQSRHFKERLNRRSQLEQQLQSEPLSPEERRAVIEEHEQRESTFTRLQRQRLSMSDFEPLKLIGKGAFGEVRICRDTTTGKLVAVKKLQKSEMVRRGQVDHVKAERNVLAEVRHYAVVKLLYSFQDEDFLYLVMEYLPGGDLMTLLIRLEILTEDMSRFYLAQTVVALEAIHSAGYIHRDIKPDNLLLDANGRMKLSDFGLCKPVDVGALPAFAEADEDTLRRIAVSFCALARRAIASLEEKQKKIGLLYGWNPRLYCPRSPYEEGVWDGV